jgi:hypothetical protein
MRRATLVLLLAMAVVSFAGVAGVRYLSAPPGPPTAGPAPSSPEAEAGYGLRLTRATLAAEGGIVDLRFLILDTVRAEPVLGHQARERVRLLDTDSGIELDTRAMSPGDSNLLAGEGYYMLFRNSGGAIRRGDEIAVLIGDKRISGVTVG